MSDSLKKGILFALLAALISGCSIFYNKLVVVKVDPQIFNILKNGGVGIILTALLLMNKKQRPHFQLSRNQWGKLIAIAIIGGGVPFILFFEGLRSVAAINANILQKTMFIWVAMMAVPFLKEKISPVQMIGYLLVAWSNLFIGGFTGFKWTGAEAMIIMAAILWSVETIIIKTSVKDIEPTVVAWARMTLGIVVIFGYVAYQGHLGLFMKLTPGLILPILGSIALLTVYGLAWISALKYAPATVVAVLLILATPLTNVLSAVFITHILTWPQMMNLGGTLLGIGLIAYFSSTQLQTPKEQRV